MADRTACPTRWRSVELAPGLVECRSQREGVSAGSDDGRVICFSSKSVLPYWKHSPELGLLVHQALHSMREITDLLLLTGIFGAAAAIPVGVSIGLLSLLAPERFLKVWALLCIAAGAWCAMAVWS